MDQIKKKKSLDDLVIPLLAIDPREMKIYIQTKIYTQMSKSGNNP